MSQTTTATTANNPLYYTFVMFFIYFDFQENATNRTLAHTFTTLQKSQCVPSEYAFRFIRIVTSKLNLTKFKVWEKLVLNYSRLLTRSCMFLCIDFCVVAVKTSMGLVRSPIRLTEIRLVSNFLLKLLCFPWLLEISCTIPKWTLSRVSFFHHFRCQFVSFFSVVNVPTTTVPILMSTLARRRRCARIFLKGSVDEDSRYVCSYCSLFSCLLLSFLLPLR